jgi:hypothetical protein
MFLPKVTAQQLAALALSATCFIIVIFFDWAAKQTWEQLVFSFISSCFIAELQWPSLILPFIIFSFFAQTAGHPSDLYVHSFISITLPLGYSSSPYINIFCL